MNSGSKSKVFITGADGFIGSHVTSLLAAEGFDVTALSLYNSFGTHGWLDTLTERERSAIKIVSGDIRDATQMRSFMQGADIVLHLAALIGIPYSYSAPRSYVSTNIDGTVNILDAARDLKVKKVIVTSTSEVYGTAQFVPITEEHPLNAQSPYAATKIAADQLSLSYHRSFETPVTVLRPFNTFGPRQSLRAVIPTIITQLARGAKTISLGSLTPTRDLTYVEDTAKGYLAAIRANGIEGKSINLGTNFEISIKDLAELIGEVMGQKVSFTEDPSRVRPSASEVERLLSDNTLAKTLLKWSPEHAGRDGLKRALTKTVEWFKRPENLARYPGTEYKV